MHINFFCKKNNKSNKLQCLVVCFLENDEDLMKSLNSDTSQKIFVSMLYEEWKWYMTNARPSADWRGSPSLNKLRYRQRTHTHPCLRTCTILCVLIFLLYFCMVLIQYTKQKHMNTHPCLRTCTILHIIIFLFSFVWF